MKNKDIIVYAIVAVLIIVLLTITFFPNITYAFRDSVSDSADKCAVPAGQTEEAWREHMGHHPDIYKDCLD